MKTYLLISLFFILICSQGFGQVDTYDFNSPDGGVQKEKENDKRPRNRMFLSSNGRLKHVLKTNCFDALLIGPIPYTSEIRLAYEHILDKRTSVEVWGSYLFENLIYNINDEANYFNNTKGFDYYTTRGARGVLAFRSYVEGEAPKGFYISPRISFSYARFVDKSYKDNYLNAYVSNLVALGGYQFILGKGFAIDIFTGGGLEVDVLYTSRYLDPYTSSFAPHTDWFVGRKFVLGFNIGYAF